MRNVQRRLEAFLLAFAVLVTTICSGGPVYANAVLEAGTEGEGVTVENVAISEDSVTDKEQDADEEQAVDTDMLTPQQTWETGITDAAELAGQKAVWMDASRPVEDRVAALLSAMTLEEKAAQLVQPEQKESEGGATPQDVKNYGLGSVLSGGGSAPAGGNTAQDWADRVNALKAAALESRLGIPLIYGVDAVHGNNNVDNTVIFPHNIGLGAARDTSLVRRVGHTAAQEIRAMGIQWTFAPTLGVPYSERWGRYYECFGERAELVASMGAAYAEGFQGTGAGSFAADRVAATAKHYIGEGQTVNGVNQGNVELSAEEFDKLLSSEEGENLLAPYQAALDAGTRIVMASYNSVDGVKCHGNKHLLTDILKGEKTQSNPLGLGFTGFVVSDYNGVDQLPDASYEEKVASSINAGVDMFMEPYDWKNFINAVTAGYGSGTISAARIDDAVSRILRVKFEMGLFEEEVASAAENTLLEKVGCEAHRAVAKEAVEKSLTVLKNEQIGASGKTALQLLDEAGKIVVGGYKANDIGAQCGGWTISWQGGLDCTNGSGGKKVTEGTTIYEGFQEAAAADPALTVSYNARGKVSAGSDAAVIVVGEDPYAESNGDKTEAELTLSATDRNVLKTALESAGDTPLILVLMTGRPVAIADYVDDFDAIVEAWLPGSEGDGIASVMLDDTKDFSATIPVTWTWYPQDLSYKFTDPAKVLFANGTGLKKDGTSVNPGGQTQIPQERPEKPQAGEAAAVLTRAGGVDIDAYEGRLEGEFCKPTSGVFNSWNIGTGSESVSGASIGYAQWNGGSWGNAKWAVYFRQAGTYELSARIHVTKAGNNNFTLGIGTAVTGDGTDGMLQIPYAVTDGYETVNLGEVTVAETGLHGVKIMDGNDPGVIGAKLDYLQFTLKEAAGDKDVSTDEPVSDPGDETIPASNGNVIASDAVRVWMTSSENSQNMSWYKYPTPMANQMTEKDKLSITSVDASDYTTITVNENKTYQELLGMGTSLEEATVNNLSQLTPQVQDEFLRKLVDPKQGGMTLFRITIGTSDFTAKPFYTYYDAKTLHADNAIYNAQTKTYEPDWQNTTGHGFTIQKDIDYKIVDTVKKVIALAKEYGVEDEVKFFASSWTPPGWMKNETDSSRSYSKNELLIKGGALKDTSIDDLAMYYTRYLEEYAKQGIDIYAITLQNEPMLEIDYPSCAMTGEQEGKLAVAVKKAIASSTVLNASQKKCKLWAFDHNPGDAYSYVQKILSVNGANEALDGVAFHDYGGSLTNLQTVLDELLNQGARKDQTVNLTERSVWGMAGANSIITYLRNSAISYNSWVTMLDSNVGVHQWVGTPDPTMFARAAGSDNDYWAMPEFYITGQFSRFIRPGYVRVASSSGSTDTVTNVVFKNPQTDEYTAVVVNGSNKKQDFKVVCAGTQFIGSLPAGNMATYVWTGPKNIHSDPAAGFAADEFNAASAGVVTNAEHGVTLTAETDYVDYVVDVKEAGTYNLRLVEQGNEENQAIKVSQSDQLLGEIKVLKHGDAKTVQGQITFANAGVQQIRIMTTAGLKLSRLALIKAKEVHQMPGKIRADEFCQATSTFSVADDHSIDNLAWWGCYLYKVNIPAEDTYTLTVSAATENTETVGFIVLKDGVEQANEIASVVNGWGDQAGSFHVSGSWSEYVTTSVDVVLEAGEHTIGFKTAAPININWFSLGSSMDLSSAAIMEGAEDGSTIHATISGGTIADTDALAAGVSSVSVNGLPEGVTTVVEPVGANHDELNITLEGNRSVDFDEDQRVAVSVWTRQKNEKIYPMTETFVIHAVDDEEGIAVTTSDLSVPPAVGDTRELTLELRGGTLRRQQLEEEGKVTIAGDGARFYTLTDVTYVDATTAKLTLKYNKAFYRGVNLDITIPADCYDAGAEALTTSVAMRPVDGFPSALTLSQTTAVTLTEDKAYANSGSLKTAVAAGNYTDYFLDVKDAGTYVITYIMHTITKDGTSYANAWEVNRGVAGTLGTNSYKQVSIPGLWMDSNVKLRHAVELPAGKQTLEFKAKSGGYEISSIQVEAAKAAEITAEIGATTTLQAQTYMDVANACIVDGSNLAYTVKGTALDYRITVSKSGTYELKTNYAIESNGSVRLKADRIMEKGAVALGSVALAATGAWSTYKDSDALSIDLPAGTYVLRLTLEGDGANLKNYALTYREQKEVVDPQPEDPETPDGPDTPGSSDKPGDVVIPGGPVTPGDLELPGGQAGTEQPGPVVSVAATGVKLNVSRKTMYKGKSYTLKTTVTPAASTDKLTWSSSKKSVARVDARGRVTAVKKGTATITVKTASGKKATCKITVKEIKSKKVKLNKTRLTLKKGKSYTLKASMTPKNSTDSVKWTSSNKKVVTVTKNGRLKALKKGTATITVKTASGKKATCRVTVK